MRDLCQVTDSADRKEDCQGHVVHGPEAGWKTCQVREALIEGVSRGVSRGVCEGKGLVAKYGR